MLRISRIADYGVVLATRLAQPNEDRPDEDTRSVPELARETGVPQPTVGKILKRLAREGILESIRGARGGYRLARLPEQVTVADVIIALDGPIGMTECGHGPDHGECELWHRCGVRGNWQRISEAITDALASITLADMAQPSPSVAAELVQLGRGRALTQEAS